METINKNSFYTPQHKKQQGGQGKPSRNNKRQSLFVGLSLSFFFLAPTMEMMDFAGFGLEDSLEYDAQRMNSEFADIATLSLVSDEEEDEDYSEEEEIKDGQCQQVLPKCLQRKERNKESARAWRERQKSEIATLTAKLRQVTAMLDKAKEELALARVEVNVSRSAAEDFRMIALFIWSRNNTAAEPVGTPPNPSN